MEEIRLGQYALPVILTMVLGIVYMIAGESIPKRIKPLIPIGIGVGVSLLALGYMEKPWIFRVVVDHILYGAMMGAASVGIHQSYKKGRTSGKSNSGPMAVFLIFVVAFSGCAWTGKKMLEGVNDYAEGVRSEMQAAEKLMSVWLYRSEQLRTAMGARWETLPGDAKDEWRKLDAACYELGYDVLPPRSLWPVEGQPPSKVTINVKIGPDSKGYEYEVEGITQSKLGHASGTWVLISWEVIREAVKKIAPDVLGLLPAFL